MKVTRRILLAASLLMFAALVAIPAEAAKYNLKATVAGVKPHPMVVMAEYTARELEKRSGGEIAVKLFTGNQLGSRHDQAEMTRLGTIDIATLAVGDIVAFIAELEVFTPNYVFPNYKAFRAVTNTGSPVFKKFAALFDKKMNVELLALSGGGNRVMSNVHKPVMKPTDITGYKFRVGNSPIESKTWRSQGAVPVPLAYREIYSALQTRLLDATEHSLSGYTSLRFYEQAPHLALTEHKLMVTGQWVSKKTLAKLPKKHRDLLREIGAEVHDVGIKAGIEADSRLVGVLKSKYKVKVTQPDKAAFRNNVSHLLDEVARKPGGTGEIMRMIQSITAKNM